MAKINITLQVEVGYMLQNKPRTNNTVRDK